MKDPLLKYVQFLCFSVVVAVVFVSTATVTGTETETEQINEQLHYFETLKHVDVRVRGRQKRSVDGSHVDVKDVSFSAFGRNFNLVLTPGSPVLSADLSARLVFGDGRSAPLHINNNQFFTGHLAENESVKADAHTESGMWTANIYEKDDVYILEPSSGHLPPSDNHSMIVYKQSDIKWENIFPDLASKPGQKQTMCKSLHPEDEDDYDAGLEEEEEKRHEHLNLDFNRNRSRRGSPTRNTCHIIAVADYTFYRGPGGGFPHQTANYVIQTLQKVNRIFKDTIWNKNQGLYNMGFQIKELRVHSEPTDANKAYRGLHYNMQRSSWPDHDLLRQFGEDTSFHNFCLAHLFTYRQFAGGVLGLAYIAPARKYAVGGICSNSRTRRAMNTGFSSAMNTKGKNLLTQEAVLVTTHEFGHNWGAEHDAETKECAPSSFNNGKFLMYPYAVSGFEENNYHFSPCSKRYITSALVTRSGQCFKRPEEEVKKKLTANVPMCGNGIIDKGEDCDGGSRGLADMDPCCSKTCKYKGAAVCSPANYECCADCKMASNGTMCRGQSRMMCQKEAYCTGFSLECPDSKHFPNGDECVDEGECLDGQCKDYCYVMGAKKGQALKPCQCDQDRVSACKRCCKSENSVCEPLGSENLQDGRPCGYGYCEDGYCKTAHVNMIKRLFSFIENLDSSTLVEFMRANIVGTIIVFSLVIWVPLSWLISILDKRYDKKTREQDPWLSRDALLNMSLQSQHFPHGEDYKVREPVGRFKATTDIKGRPYWTGAGDVGGGGDGYGKSDGSYEKGGGGGFPGYGNNGGGGGSYEKGGGDGFAGYDNNRSGGGGGHDDRGGGGEGDVLYRGGNAGQEEKTYKPRSKGDGPLEFESTV